MAKKALLLNVRMKPADKRRVVAAAKRAHLSVSAWMRTILLAEAARMGLHVRQ